MHAFQVCSCASLCDLHPGHNVDTPSPQDTCLVRLAPGRSCCLLSILPLVESHRRFSHVWISGWTRWPWEPPTLIWGCGAGGIPLFYRCTEPHICAHPHPSVWVHFLDTGPLPALAVTVPEPTFVWTPASFIGVNAWK